MIIRSMNNEKEFPEGTTVKACLEALGAFPRGTLAAQSGGVVCELNDVLRQDCTLTPLTLENEEGRRIYERSLRFVMLLALRHLYPYQRVRIEYSVGYGVFVRLPGIELHRQDIVRIENEMRRIAELDLVFEKKRWTQEEAIRYFEEEQMPDKVNLLKHRTVPYFNMYCIDGMWEYFYGAMTVSTGYVKVFTMFELRGGFVLQLPAGADFDHAAPYVYRPKHLEIFNQSAEWCEILGVTNVSDLSGMIEHKKLRNFIRVNEALHEAAIHKIAKNIHEQNKHIVLVAGPSSSGKTTFSGRLGVHLQMYGHACRRISMDDFFINRDEMPLQVDGTKDYDSIDALDLKLLSDTLTGLLNGEEVFMPNFDFASGTKDYMTPPTSLAPGEIIIMEGIHGLNPQVCEMLPADEIYKIFASALTVLNLDDHNRIRTTDVRLLRRIVRDNQFRGYPPETTLEMWPRVRSAEEKYIFTYQENADSMFNTALQYELPILKLFAYKLLMDVPSSSPNYLLSRRLIKVLNYLPDVDEEVLNEIPPLSLLREFIGGCTMEEV
ncbi:nucleoside kinase [Aristaeella lactis]|uniref:Uridine kinase n=1 Tax=Aristaeella lactis TaxID=3046383 RepID=A0AC61PMF2_9FIRM|nr:nucleoside kinase [Aristaeella lactis]QUA53143.1 nucleoside kinase [Aristaeella lactis]SMC68228.1 uridine kinase [Aristaeella lactis]